MDNENVNSTKENKDNKESIMEKYKIRAEIVSIILGIIIIVYPIIDYVYKIIYKNTCEEFYNIPGHYFNTTINNKILYVGLLLALIVLFILPHFLLTKQKKNGVKFKGEIAYYLIISILLGSMLGFINILNITKIMKYTHVHNKIFNSINTWLDKNAYIVIAIIFITSIIAIVYVTSFDQILNTRNKAVKTIRNIVCYICLLFNLVILFYGTVCILSTSVYDISNYEIVTYQDSKYVVLSELDNDVLVVPYSISNNRYTFYTKTYQFLEKKECSISYINTNETPIIEKDKSYKE